MSCVTIYQNLGTMGMIVTILIENKERWNRRKAICLFCKDCETQVIQYIVINN